VPQHQVGRGGVHTCLGVGHGLERGLGRVPTQLGFGSGYI